MKRTTITLPDDVADLIRREAHRRATSTSSVTREAVLQHLAPAGSKGRLPIANLGASGHKNTSRDAEESIESEWRP